MATRLNTLFEKSLITWGVSVDDPLRLGSVIHTRPALTTLPVTKVQRFDVMFLTSIPVGFSLEKLPFFLDRRPHCLAQRGLSTGIFIEEFFLGWPYIRGATCKESVPNGSKHTCQLLFL